MAASGQRQWPSTSNSRFCGVLFPRRVLVDVGDVESSARGVSATGITDGTFSCVVKTQKCRSNKIYKNRTHRDKI